MTTSSLTVFSFQGKSVRTQHDESRNIWFCLGDVLYTMGTTQTTTAALSALDDVFDKGYAINLPLETNGGIQDALFISEGATNFLISRSRTESGKLMNRWIHNEVLPSIRKTGSYSIAPSQPQLPSRVLAVETAEAIDRIQDILSKSNPRLAQILIDCAMNDVVESKQLPSAESKQLPSNDFPDDRWYGLVQIADKMGIKTNHSTRTKLGQHFTKLISSGEIDVDRAREERICNGQYEPIWCYRDNEVVRKAIQDWAQSIV